MLTANTELNIFRKNVPHTTPILQSSIVGIAGCGGLGSNIAVSIVRAGVGKLIIADYDAVEASNLNRQHFFQSDIGKPKVIALADHLKAINPGIHIIIYNKKLVKEDIAVIFKSADLMIEAFDVAQEKKWLIEQWCLLYPKKVIICGNGIGGIGNFSGLTIKQSGNAYFCGDGQSDINMGLCSTRVALVANMQANLAIEVLFKKKKAEVK